MVDQDAIIQYVIDTFRDVEMLRPTDGPGAGDTFFYYEPRHNLDASRRLPFATIVTKDYGDFDNSSNLNRPGVFRLNIGVSSETFGTLFARRPGEVSAETATYDFAALNSLMPHPIYARQSWVSVLNPGVKTFEAVKPLLAEAYSLDRERYHRSHAADL